MSDDVRHVIFESQFYVMEPRRRLRKRLNYFGKIVSRALAQLGTFEALAAVVMLLARAEASPPSIGLRRAAHACYFEMQNYLLKNPDIAPAIEEVFERIDEQFEQWVGIHDQMQLALPVQSKYLRGRNFQR